MKMPTLNIAMSNPKDKNNSFKSLQRHIDQMTVLAMLPAEILKEVRENGKPITVVQDAFDEQEENFQGLYSGNLECFQLNWNGFDGVIDVTSPRTKNVTDVSKMYYILSERRTYGTYFTTNDGFRKPGDASAWVRPTK